MLLTIHQVTTTLVEIVHVCPSYDLQTIFNQMNIKGYHIHSDGNIDNLSGLGSHIRTGDRSNQGRIYSSFI